MLTFAAAAAADGTGILCKILLIGLIVALVVGIAQALGFLENRFASSASPLGRLTGLAVFLLLLLVYVFFCGDS